jgi:hypothetical protein
MVKAQTQHLEQRMNGEVVRYNVLSGRFAVVTRNGYIIAELRAGSVAEGMSVEWADPISTPAHFRTTTGSRVEATIVDVDVSGRELMDLLGPW